MSKKNLFFLLAFTAATLTLSAQQLKGDPWIFKVYQELYNRQPTAWELNIKLYNNGSWNNYNELKKYIQDYNSSLASNGISVTVITLTKTGNSAALINQNGVTIAADIVSPNGGTIVAQGGGNIVAQGGGNIVAQGGGNLASIPGASLGSNRQLMAGDKKIIKTSGNGAIIIR